jgi:pimeloyl-ACP methyl ester carboxylesterase
LIFRRLILLLEDRYRLIAPDHIGFGRSGALSLDVFDYSFDALARITEGLLDTLGVREYAM